ncbi:MAG: hypothetical protein NE327_13865 [Lentisphaeraceae bacterium]|nr:hypothetical protein [Lentisphaeraceae bacterium]
MNLYLQYAPLTTGVIGLCSTLIYRLRFTSKWLNDHKIIEENNIHFEEDILRATWLSELVFEWEKENPGKPFPEKLIEVYSNNLFDRVLNTPTVKHPVEDLADLSNKFSKVKIGKTGIEVESKK